MAKNKKSESRSKYIDIKYLTIREHIKEKKVIIKHINSELIIGNEIKGESKGTCRQNEDYFPFYNYIF